MIDTSLKIMTFMWCVSFSLIGVQLVIADEYGIVMKSADGTPMLPELLKLTNQELYNDTLESLADEESNPDLLERITDSTTSAALVAWELVQLLSGTYIFNLLAVFGIPVPFIAIVAILYMAFLARTVIGYVRGV